ncbi:MAG: type II toxin-antitoxin system VapC family toxin [Patescibacteria group bacterium]|nr:type II toxin-antitoxin system VapC family toxin [Patescibacteria group bacterium]
MEKLKRYFVDSDILIDYLRGRPKTRDFLFKLRKKGVLIISVINLVEIYSGREIKEPEKKRIIKQFLSEFEIITLEENSAQEAGEIRRKYQLPFADSIIAAIALRTQSILVSRNIRHYSKIKNLKLLVPK